MCECAAESGASTADRKTCCEDYTQNPDRHFIRSSADAKGMENTCVNHHQTMPDQEKVEEDEEEKKTEEKKPEEKKTEDKSDPCTDLKPGSDERGQCCKDHFAPLMVPYEKKLRSYS